MSEMTYHPNSLTGRAILNGQDALAGRRRGLSGLDMRRTIRSSMGTGGVPVKPVLRRKRPTKPDLIVLCDVSGSMDSYARALLLFLHAVVGSGSGVEAFAFGTRLSRLTPDLGTRDPEAALERCTAAVLDWEIGRAHV